MRVALITRGFTGSILPLAKQMLKDGHNVDIFIICNRVELDDIEAFECNYLAKRLGLQLIPDSCWNSTKVYMQSDNVRLFCVRYLRPYDSIPLLKHFISAINSIHTNGCLSFINKQGYNLINIVCGYYSQEYIPYITRLSVRPVVSLHEVCNHFAPDFEHPSQLLKLLFDKKLPIIVYSNNSLNDILNYTQADKNLIYRINFGNFTSYESIHKDQGLVLPEKYVLFFGTLKKYKGLGVLFDAITKYNSLPKNVKCVVAGAGYDESFELMKQNERFVCIQKRLTNAELVRLISDAIVVISPYLTMSQSGIPQTVFVYNKPIIASDLKGFTELLDDSNSLIFETGNAADLSDKISKILQDDYLYESLKVGIMQFSQSSSPYSWEYIAKQYLQFVKK